MSKPDDIPEGVWHTAYDACFRGDWSVVEEVARAIMAATQAERKACAELAMAAIEAGDERHDVWLERYDLAISIASAIRKRGEP